MRLTSFFGIHRELQVERRLLRHLVMAVSNLFPQETAFAASEYRKCCVVNTELLPNKSDNSIHACQQARQMTIVRLNAMRMSALKCAFFVARRRQRSQASSITFSITGTVFAGSARRALRRTGRGIENLARTAMVDAVIVEVDSCASAPASPPNVTIPFASGMKNVVWVLGRSPAE